MVTSVNKKQEKPNYYFILTAGRYMYDDLGEEHSPDKIKIAIEEMPKVVKTYPENSTDSTIIEEVRNNSFYRFFNRAILVDIKSKENGFDPNQYEILSYQSFKI